MAALPDFSRAAPYAPYSRDGFAMTPHQLAQALALFGNADGPCPMTDVQAGFVLSRGTGIVATGAAGTGKSLSLARRTLVVHHVLAQDLDRLCVFTPTHALRHNLVATLNAEARRCAIPLDMARIEHAVVRSFQSKALELSRGLLRPGARLFDLLGTPHEGIDAPANASGSVSVSAAVNARASASAALSLDDTTPAEQAANSLPSLYPETTDAQCTWVNRLFAECHASSVAFRDAVDALRVAALSTPAIARDHADVIEAMTRIDAVARDDASFCARVERDWSATGLWPMAGVESSEHASIEIDGHRLRAHGRLEGSDIDVFLGTRSRLRDKRLDETDSSSQILAHANWNRSRIVLGHATRPVLFIQTVAQLQHLAQQLKYRSAQRLKCSDSFLMIAPGEHTLKPIAEVLYEHGALAEHLGLDPREVPATTPLGAARIRSPCHASILVIAASIDEPTFAAIRRALGTATCEEITFITYTEMAAYTADAVVLLGDAGPSETHPARDALFEAASPMGSHTARECEAGYRAVYSAMTRARKICLWLGDPFTHGAMHRMPRQIKRCVRTDSRGAVDLIEREFAGVFNAAIKHTTRTAHVPSQADIVSEQTLFLAKPR